MGCTAVDVLGAFALVLLIAAFAVSMGFLVRMRRKKDQ